jgi:hypothetical protein
MTKPLTPGEVVNSVPRTRLIRIGGNTFVENIDEGVSDDLQQEIRDLADEEESEC